MCFKSKGGKRKEKERKGKKRKGKERKGKERKGKERKGKERKERKGREEKGKGYSLDYSLQYFTPQHGIIGQPFHNVVFLLLVDFEYFHRYQTSCEKENII
jgi:hypothetical protein